MKGILVSVLRPVTDCTNGGVSATANEFVLCGEGLPEVFEPNEETPALVLKRRGTYLYAEPVEKPEGTCGPMAGGNFVYTSDSRFRRVSVGPVAVHDRFDTFADNERLSQ